MKKYCDRITSIFTTFIFIISISYIVLFVCNVSIKLIPHVNIENYSEIIDYGVLSEEQTDTFNKILDAIKNEKYIVSCPAYSAREKHEILTQLGLYYGTTENVGRLVYYWNDNSITLNLKIFKKLSEKKVIIDARVDEAVSTLIEGSDKYKLWQISNYISRKITYTDGCRDMIIALNGRGVCDSYATLFYKMATRVGIKTYICYGYVDNEYHAWNAVELNGEYVYYDITWYDSIIYDIKYIFSDSSWDRNFQINNKWSSDLKEIYKNIQIKNSYNIWNPSIMKEMIEIRCYKKYNSMYPTVQLNRDYNSMYIEWWLHNIGYYITKPFCFIKRIEKINLRLRDVDINEWI